MVRREARSAVNGCFQLLWPWFVASNDGAAVIARYGWDEVRFSISWKAYCFADERERRAWRGHGDDLVLERILNRLVDDLRARGRLRSDRPPPTSLALALIDEYVKFPPRWRPEGTRPRGLVHGLTLAARNVRDVSPRVRCGAETPA